MFFNMPSLVIFGAFVSTFCIAYLSADSNFAKLQRTERTTVTNSAKTTLKNEKERLRTLLRNLGNDSRLTRHFLASVKSKDFSRLKAKANKLKKHHNLDLIDIIDDLSGAASLEPSLSNHNELQSIYRKKRSGFLIHRVKNQLILLGFSPLHFHSLREGILVVGTSLNDTLAKQISQDTNASISFVTNNTSIPIDLIPFASFDKRIFLRIEDSQSSKLSRSTLLVILFVGLFTAFLLSLVLKLYLKRVRTQSRKEMYAEVAEGVSHDLKSPLIALENALSDDLAGTIPVETKKKIRATFGRVKDISNALSARRRSMLETSTKIVPLQSVMLVRLCNEILSEKRIQYRALSQVELDDEFDSKAYGVFSKINTIEFKRMLSNLIDNAVESLSGAGSVILRIDRRDNFCVVRVIDSGIGIPKEHLSKVFQKGATFGKEEGSGLGLWQAKKSVEVWGGSIQIDSKNGYGTTVHIILPESKAPFWFVPYISLTSETKIIVLDDDKEILKAWEKRFKQFSMDKAFYSINIEEVTSWWKENFKRNANIIFLCDFSLGKQKLNGLEIIRRLKAQRVAILVTNHFDNASVHSACKRENIRMIPKELMRIIEIKRVSKCRNEGVA